MNSDDYRAWAREFCKWAQYADDPQKDALTDLAVQYLRLAEVADGNIAEPPHKLAA